MNKEAAATKAVVEANKKANEQQAKQYAQGNQPYGQQYNQFGQNNNQQYGQQKPVVKEEDAKLMNGGDPSKLTAAKRIAAMNKEAAATKAVVEANKKANEQQAKQYAQ